MRVTRLVLMTIALSAACHLVAPEATAQYVPYSRYGGWGAFPDPSRGVVDRGVMAAQEGADRRQSLAQNFAQHQAMNQFLVGESQRRSMPSAGAGTSVNDLRMQTLASQARPRAAEPAASFAPVSAPLPLRLPTLSSATTADPLAASVEPGTGESSRTVSTAGGKELRWPTLLRTSPFDEPRQEIEQVLTAAESRDARPTAAECREIAALLGQMKGILRGLASQLNAEEYLAVEDVLDGLIARAKSAAESSK